MKRLGIITLITLISISLLCGCGKEKIETPEEAVIKQEPPVAKPVEKPVEEPEEIVGEIVTHEGEKQSFLTGEWVSEEKAATRPVAIMLGNTVDALPQNGIGEAEILYECPVEGGLTRLMGIYDDFDNVENIGSVRSCRLYFAHLAVEFDAIYCHYGQASYAEPYLKSGEISDLNGLDGKVDSITFFREPSRKQPHNAFVTPKGLADGIAYKEFKTEHDSSYKGHFVFAEDGFKEIAVGDQAYVMRPGYPIDKPWFIYDETNKVYNRFQYKKEHIDGTTGKQLAYTNVIFQYMDGKKLDKKGYFEYETTGSGKGLFFTGGKVCEVTWKKSDLHSPARFYDGSGNEIILNQGKTCVCVVDSDSTDKVSVYKTVAEFESAQ